MGKNISSLKTHHTTYFLTVRKTYGYMVKLFVMGLFGYDIQKNYCNALKKDAFDTIYHNLLHPTVCK